MLGWHITVFRQTNSGVEPATFDSKTGPRIAVWQADYSGLNWFNELAKQDKALDLGGAGYPTRFSAQAKHLMPTILAGPPSAREVWVSDATDILTSQWVGRTLVDHDEAANCGEEEWLLVVAWDES
ncbi:MAG TPA: hypothetical protein VL285_23390 [Bryobacteraceae bacterium]|jgi:hypothetical protein|nr:hypothetical protein [Bryobacteraceae bacterium]